MSVEMVFNELSLRAPLATIHAARAAMSTFVDTLAAATRKGVESSLRTSIAVQAAPLAPNYILAQWRNDRDVDLEQRRYFRTLVTKSPLLLEIDDADREILLGLTDCLCNGERADGLAFAYVFGALPVSVRSAPRWEPSRLTVEVSQLRGEEI